MSPRSLPSALDPWGEAPSVPLSIVPTQVFWCHSDREGGAASTKSGRRVQATTLCTFRPDALHLRGRLPSQHELSDHQDNGRNEAQEQYCAEGQRRQYTSDKSLWRLFPDRDRVVVAIRVPSGEKPSSLIGCGLPLFVDVPPEARELALVVEDEHAFPIFGDAQSAKAGRDTNKYDEFECELVLRDRADDVGSFVQCPFDGAQD